MLDKLKRRLGITDNSQDELLNDIIEDAQAQFMLITGASHIDPKFDFIIRDVSAKLYTRKGSEGLNSESVDGYSATYRAELFSEYMDLLEREFDLTSDGQRRRGRLWIW